MDVAKVVQYFEQADPVIFAVLKDVDLSTWYREPVSPDLYFHKLVDQIISQQLNVKVADIIAGRLLALTTHSHFFPSSLLQISDEDLRSVGLSRSKVEYIKNLATLTESGQLQFERFETFSDEEVVTELTKLKGVGRWTAEMFLMFALGKPDVFSHGDYGLRSGMKKLYNLAEQPTLAEATQISDKWRPYRSFGSYAVWHSLDMKE